MAPNGFTQRFRGKVQAAALWLGSSPQSGPNASVSYSTAAGGGQTLGFERMSKIVSSSAATVWALPVNGIGGGVSKELVLDISSAAFIKAPTGGGFNGTTLSVAKSTYDMQVSLVAMSSVQYAIMGAYPDTTFGGAPVGGITLTTST